MSEKYTLISGCHRGTLVSRDSGADEYDSEEEARTAFDKQRIFWQRIGYQVWFATLKHPDGTETVLSHGEPYY